MRRPPARWVRSVMVPSSVTRSSPRYASQTIRLPSRGSTSMPSGRPPVWRPVPGSRRRARRAASARSALRAYRNRPVPARRPRRPPGRARWAPSAAPTSSSRVSSGAHGAGQRGRRGRRQLHRPDQPGRGRAGNGHRVIVSRAGAPGQCGPSRNISATFGKSLRVRPAECSANVALALRNTLSTRHLLVQERRYITANFRKQNIDVPRNGTEEWANDGRRSLSRVLPASSEKASPP